MTGGEPRLWRALALTAGGVLLLVAVALALSDEWLDRRFGDTCPVRPTAGAPDDYC